MKDFIDRNIKKKNPRWDWATEDFNELARMGDLNDKAQYLRADVAHNAGLVKQTLELLTAYLKNFGRNGAHYQDAITLFAKCKQEEAALAAKVAADKEAADKARDEADRLKRPASATKERPLENSLGMQFVPVPGTKLLFCIWGTRWKDYAAYADDKGGVDKSWRKPRFTQTETHPVVKVSWNDAKAFCAWLMEKERSEGLIGSDQEYRLPTDEEWSYAVGIGGQESGNTPADKDGKIKNVYPWGSQWPPPNGAGNFDDYSSSKIPGYSDGFERTAPAGIFKLNQFGIFDLSGNVWEWCEDWYNSEQKYRVLRGGSWNNNNSDNLLSSNRNNNGLDKIIVTTTTVSVLCWRLGRRFEGGNHQ